MNNKDEQEKDRSLFRISNVSQSIRQKLAKRAKESGFSRKEIIKIHEIIKQAESKAIKPLTYGCK